MYEDGIPAATPEQLFHGQLYGSWAVDWQLLLLMLSKLISVTAATFDETCDFFARTR